MKEIEMIAKLESMLSQNKFEHSLRVRDTAEKLAQIYNCDIEKTKTAAILHDCAKGLDCERSLNLCCQYNIYIDEITKKRFQLIHAPLGAEIARREFGIEDKEILDAICWHTTGRPNMTLLEKIIWLADYIEPSRNFDKIEEIRYLAYTNLDKALLRGFEESMNFIRQNNKELHPNTLLAYEYVLSHMEN